MTNEDKQLLLTDLCGRLPYGVKGKVYAEDTNGNYDITGDMIFFDSPFDVILDEINITSEEIHVSAIGNEDTVDFIEMQQTDGKPYTIDEFKPYLRPLSSMIGVEKVIYKSLKEDIDEDYCEIIQLPLIDWLNAHHFDYRGLIKKGLALEAPCGMYESLNNTTGNE